VGQLYGSLAALYRVADSIRRGDLPAARDHLAHAPSASYTTVARARSLQDTASASLPEEIGALLAHELRFFPGRPIGARDEFAHIAAARGM